MDVLSFIETIKDRGRGYGLFFLVSMTIVFLGFFWKPLLFFGLSLLGLLLLSIGLIIAVAQWRRHKRIRALREDDENNVRNIDTDA